MLAYEKCYALTSASAGSFNNCIAAHEAEVLHRRLSDHGKLVEHSRGQLLASRGIGPLERRSVHVPAAPDRVYCENRVPPPHTIEK